MIFGAEGTKTIQMSGSDDQHDGHGSSNLLSGLLYGNSWIL